MSQAEEEEHGGGRQPGPVLLLGPARDFTGPAA